MFVGYPTVQAIWGNKIASPLLDQYLAGVGFDGQQDPQPVSPDREDNLFEPVRGDHGAHGRFDSEAREWSPERWASMHKTQLGLAALGAAAAAGIGFMFANRSNDKERARERS